MLQMREISSTDFAVNIDEKSTGRRLLCRGDRGEIVSFPYLMMKNDVVSSLDSFEKLILEVKSGVRFKFNLKILLEPTV